MALGGDARGNAVVVAGCDLPQDSAPGPGTGAGGARGGGYPWMADERIHAFTGGQPDSLDELRARFRRQAEGHSPDAPRVG